MTSIMTNEAKRLGSFDIGVKNLDRWKRSVGFQEMEACDWSIEFYSYVKARQQRMVHLYNKLYWNIEKPHTKQGTNLILTA